MQWERARIINPAITRKSRFGKTAYSLCTRLAVPRYFWWGESSRKKVGEKLFESIEPIISLVYFLSMRVKLSESRGIGGG